MSFGPWYRARLGKQPIVLQVILWWFYGFIWIPIWWLVSRNESGGTSLLSNTPGIAFASGDGSAKSTNTRASTSKYLIAALGVILFLLVLLIPAIQSARVAVSRKNELASFQIIREGQLSNHQDLPPPIEEALAIGRDVWLLHDYRFVDAQPGKKYLVVTNHGVEKIVNVWPTGSWGEWAKAAQPKEQQIPSYQAYSLQRGTSEPTFTEYRKTGIPGWDEVEATQLTTITIPNGSSKGSWIGKNDSGRIGAVVPKNSKFRAQQGSHSGIAEIIAK